MITSVQNETIKELLKYHQAKYRNSDKKYLVEGWHLVEEAYRKGVVDMIITTVTVVDKFIGVKILEVSKNVLNKLAFTSTPQPIMALCKVVDISIDYNKMKKLVILDGLQDPGNVGTIIRTSLAFGYDAVILSDDSVDLYNDKCIRATQGSLFHIPCLRGDIIEVITKIREYGGFVLATSLHNARELNEYNQDNVSLVFGNEGKGVKESTMAVCNGSVYIDMSGIDSLNVAIAAGIALYYFK